MKTKSFFSVIASAAALALSACGGQSHAAGLDIALKSTYSSPTVIPFTQGRWIDLTPGAQYFTNVNNQKSPIVMSAADVTTLLNSPTFNTFYVKVSTYVYLNPAGAASITCPAGQSIIGWYNSGADFLSDNCAAFNAAWAAAN